MQMKPPVINEEFAVVVSIGALFHRKGRLCMSTASMEGKKKVNMEDRQKSTGGNNKGFLCRF